ncbi:MAG: RNA-binding protein, partial [Planctomycetota bacterium]
MGKRLYVGNLPYDADEQTLRTAFSQDGRTVERVHIVLDRETQRPRGFAFVEMATDEQAKAAMAAMDGAVFGTRQLRVTEAEERRAGPGGPGGPG